MLKAHALVIVLYCLSGQFMGLFGTNVSELELVTSALVFHFSWAARADLLDTQDLLGTWGRHVEGLVVVFSKQEVPSAI